MIEHIVMWKFKDDCKNEAEIFLTQLAELENRIEEIRYFEVKKSINEKNEFDATLISRFDSLEALAAYKVNPLHQKVSSLCKSIRVNRAAIDIEVNGD